MVAIEAAGPPGAAPLEAKEPHTAERSALRRKWAQLIRRLYEVDPLACPCGGTFQIVSVITEPKVVKQVLAHLAKVVAGSATVGPGAGPPLRHHFGPAPGPTGN